MNAAIHTCRYIEVTDLVPKSWRSWFWQLISENAPFSWGDNNRTMVDAQSFYDHCDNCLDIAVDDGLTSRSAATRFLNKVQSIGCGADSPYIDLEN